LKFRIESNSLCRSQKSPLVSKYLLPGLRYCQMTDIMCITNFCIVSSSFSSFVSSWWCGWASSCML